MNIQRIAPCGQLFPRRSPSPSDTAYMFYKILIRSFHWQILYSVPLLVGKRREVKRSQITYAIFPTPVDTMQLNDVQF